MKKERREEDIKQHIGLTLRQFRKLNGYRQDEIAELLGIKRATYSHYETGRLQPSVGALTTLAGHYHVSLDELCVQPEGCTEQNAVQKMSSEDIQMIVWYHRLNEKEQEAARKLLKILAGD